MNEPTELETADRCSHGVSRTDAYHSERCTDHEEKPIDELHADKLEETADGLRQENGKIRHEKERYRQGWALALAENRALQKLIDEQADLIRRNSSRKVAELEAVISEIRGLVNDE